MIPKEDLKNKSMTHPVRCNFEHYLKLMFGFVILGFVTSIVLIYNYYADPQSKFLCTTTGSFSCDWINYLNPYASIFGISFGMIALFFYGYFLIYLVLTDLSYKSKQPIEPINLYYPLWVLNILNIGLLYYSILLMTQFNIIPFLYLFFILLSVVFLAFVYYYEWRGKRGLFRESFSLLKKLGDKSVLREFIIIKLLSFLLLLMLLFLSLYFNMKTHVRHTKLKQVQSDNYINFLMKEFKSMPLLSVDTTNAPTLGNKNAPIHMIVYNDMQCPSCHKGLLVLKELYGKYKDVLRVSFKNMVIIRRNTPLSQLNSQQLAQYAMVANQFGKYFEFVDALFNQFRNKKYVDKTFLQTTFKNIGIQESFLDIESKLDSAKEHIQGDMDEIRTLAKKHQFRLMVPLVLFQGRLIYGENKEMLTRLIQKELIRIAAESAK